MSTHRNCPHCGTCAHDGSIRVFVIGDEISLSTAAALRHLGNAARRAAREFGRVESVTMEITGRDIIKLRNIVEDYAMPIDPSIHLAPNHQDYTPNHRKQRRSKFKRGGR